MAAGADREPFNGAVHSDSGVAVAEDDGMTETHGRGEGFGDSDWVDIALNADKFAARKSWQSPQYHIDGTYVRLRGWFASTQRVAAGAVVFRLPEEATPMRRETWKVTMKGTDRLLAVGADGVAKLAEDMPAENWMPLAGFAYNSLAAGNAGGHVEKPPESDAPREGNSDYYESTFAKIAVRRRDDAFSSFPPRAYQHVLVASRTPARVARRLCQPRVGVTSAIPGGRIPLLAPR